MADDEEQVTHHQLEDKFGDKAGVPVSSIEDRHYKPVPSRGSNTPHHHDSYTDAAVSRDDDLEGLFGVVGRDVLPQQFRQGEDG